MSDTVQEELQLTISDVNSDTNVELAECIRSAQEQLITDEAMKHRIMLANTDKTDITGTVQDMTMQENTLSDHDLLSVGSG